MKKEVVYCETEEEWIFVNSKLEESIRLPDSYFKQYGVKYKDLYSKLFGMRDWDVFYKHNNYKIYTFNEWITKINLNYKNRISMQELMLDVLNKTYDNPILRRTTIPLFMSNPGMGKSTIIKEFAISKKVGFKKITLSQRMPNEVVGALMPDKETKKWEVYDTNELADLKDGDILFFDEIFNGTLKQTLDAVLNLLEDRTLPSGKKLADIMIIAASNPQGLINLTPQIKERFIRYDLVFSSDEYKDLLDKKYGMPRKISSNLCSLINKEKFDSSEWNFKTPRSIEKAINQIGCGLKSPYNDILIPYLSEEIDSPMDVVSLDVKKGDKVSYLKFMKAIVKFHNQNQLTKKTNDTKNSKSKSRATSNILN